MGAAFHQVFALVADSAKNFRPGDGHLEAFLFTFGVLFGMWAGSCGGGGRHDGETPVVNVKSKNCKWCNSEL